MSSVAPGFLVAAPILRDPNFAGSVVLMVEHSQQGALGFIVNRVADRAIAGVLEQLGSGDTPIRNDVPVMVGGPVSLETGWVVLETGPQPDAREDTMMVSQGLAVSRSVQVLSDAVSGENGGRAMLVQGYAGWGPGQLEAELSLGVWIPVDLDARVIFDTPPDTRWAAALSVLGIHPAVLARTPVGQA